MKVGMVRKLDRLSLVSLSLNSLTLVAVTASAGREFHGWTTRLEKMYFAELVLTSGMDRRRGWPLEDGLLEKVKKLANSSEQRSCMIL